MKIGVLGGTFDPVHAGHLSLAGEARAILDLDEVVFIPAGQPWLKEGMPVTAVEHRLQMVRLAIAGGPYFRLSTMEIERPGPSYTVDTIAELRAKLGPGAEIFFIMSWDSLAGFPQWREPGRVITMCSLVVAPRPGCQRPDPIALEKDVPGISRRVIMMDRPEIDISASEIRERLARGLSIRHLVPEAVEGYIKQHKLYTGK